MSKTIEFEEQKELIPTQNSCHLKNVRGKKNHFNINYGLIVNCIIIFLIILLITICYMIGSFLANPLVIIGIILLYTLILLYNHFSVLEKAKERSSKNACNKDRKGRN